MTISVVFLARMADYGIEGATQFLASYRAHPANIAHDLVIIAKGWDAGPGYASLRRLAADHGARIIDLPDEGFDLGAYVTVASMLESDRLFFLGSSSVIVADDWLRSFADVMDANPAIELLGSSGSWESLEQAFRTVLRNMWRILPRGRRVPTMVDYVRTTVVSSIGRARAWAMFVRPLPFPNYFVRTTGFMMARRRFLEYARRHPLGPRIADANLMEHGRHSLTRFVLDAGGKVAVLGQGRRVCYPEEWKAAEIYNAPGQDKFLLIHDKRTRYYAEADATTRTALSSYSWGE